MSNVDEHQHVALYRKYRPQNFDDVVGQDHIVDLLRTQVKDNKLTHAYMFFGSRGLGKTTMARILAKEIGAAPEDIIEIDGASNSGVDNVRSLREGFATLPFSSKYKVYIIDEVHMFSKGAFNALLKSIEEPPEHVVFMFATTEPEKVPDTILSRCQVLGLRKPGVQTLSLLVSKVVKKEGFKMSDDALEMIAVSGDGSFRDTLSNLQAVLSICSKETLITAKEVSPIVLVPNTVHIDAILQGISNGEQDKIVQILTELEDLNVNAKSFLILLINRIRLILKLRFDKKTHEKIKLNLNENEFNLLLELSTIKGVKINSGLLSKLLHTLKQSKYSSLPYALIEATLYSETLE